MKKRSQAMLSGYRARTASPTGHHCPQTGMWLADEEVSPRFIFQGDVMPAVDGRPAHWTLCAEADTNSGHLRLET
jgi:hypothetical protein